MGGGLPVPPNPSPSPEDWIIVPLAIPNTDEWRGIVRGLLYEGCFGYWWDKDSGDWESARDTNCEIVRGFTMLEFCSEVARCIKENEAVRALIEALIKETTTGINPTTTTEVLGKGTTTLDECSEDHVFGAMTYLVNYLDSASRDTFQLLEASTNLWELVVEWLEDFAETSPVLALALQYVTWLQDAIAENYEAQVTTALLDEYRCDLFCLYIDNCNGLSARQVADYFLGRISGVSFGDTLDMLVDFLTDGSWEGTQIVDAMFAGMIGIMVVGENPITQIRIPTLYSFDQVVRLGANDPDPDWEILCDECVETVTVGEWDFTISDGGWVETNNRGVYSGGVGWITEVASGQSGCWIYKELPSNVEIQRIQMDWVGDNGVWRRASFGRNNPTSSSGQVEYFDATTTSDGGGQCAIVGDVNRDYILAFIDTSVDALDGVITRIAIQFTGDEPSGFTSTTSIGFACG